jgi:hydrogenase maturation protease
LVLLIDAAQINSRPGSISWLPWQATAGMNASTHTMPPYLLAQYLTQALECEVYLLGIQPLDTTLGAPLSPVVKLAVELACSRLAESLRSSAQPAAMIASHS